MIELLIVLAIIAILAVVVVLTLNPAELLRQGRDSNRVSDMSTSNEAINLYNADQGGASGYSLGSPNTVYVSIPDPNATTTAGTNCSSLGLPTLPSTYTYHCAGPNYYRKVNGTGWIPVNFSNISAGSPLSNLPVDPINSSSSRLYYTYTTNGSQFEVTAAMESAKYQVGGSNDVISTDGGPLASVYEKGSQLGLEPLDYGDPTLVGWWPLTEGTGAVAYDDSGNNATGSWNGTQAGTSGYYSPGKVGQWAGTFDGSTDYVGLNKGNLPSGSNPVSEFAWIYSTAQSGQQAVVSYGTSVAPEKVGLELNGSVLRIDCYACNSDQTFTVSMNTWHFVGFVYAGGTNLIMYLDNQSSTFSDFGPLNIIFPGSDSADIGKRSNGGTNYFPGLIDDVRIYNRALSAAQIAAMYAGGK